MSNIGSYDSRVGDFSWAAVEEELGYRPGDDINIGWYVSDRICAMGKAQKRALIWEDHQGKEKTYSFDDLRVLSNTFAKALGDLGLKQGERICLFMDRVPELYIGFVGILKLGAIAQPLFSAFREDSLLTRLDNAQTAAIITQKKHLSTVRKIVERLPNLHHVIVVDGDSKALREREVVLTLEELPRVEQYAVCATKAETPSVLHYTSGTTGQPKGAQHVHYSIISQYITSKWVLDLQETDVYWCNADPGWVTGTSYGIIGAWANGVTQVVLDSGFNADKWYRFIEKHRVTVW